MARTLVVTNDFPTRTGGIESFVFGICERIAPDDLVVYTAAMDGAAEFDAKLAYRVHRDPTGTLVPSPQVVSRVQQVMQDEGCTRVLYGASAPLGLMAKQLRAAGAERQVAITHGHEVWWAALPGTRQAMRTIGRHVDTVTYVSEWCREKISRALAPADAARMRRLSPGVDVEEYRPDRADPAVRERLGLGPETPMILSLGRLVERKGQDTLIKAMPMILAEVPEARLVIAGRGPDQERLERMVRDRGLEASVTVAGSVPFGETAAWFATADVFAMPSRARKGGLEIEAFGIVYTEAQASGVPAIVGASGGTADAVDAGRTGFLVDPNDPLAVAAPIVKLLQDPDLRRSMGAAARDYTVRTHAWPIVMRRLEAMLDGVDPDLAVDGA